MLRSRATTTPVHLSRQHRLGLVDDLHRTNVLVYELSGDTG